MGKQFIPKFSAKIENLGQLNSQFVELSKLFDPESASSLDVDGAKRSLLEFSAASRTEIEAMWRGTDNLPKNVSATSARYFAHLANLYNKHEERLSKILSKKTINEQELTQMFVAEFSELTDVLLEYDVLNIKGAEELKADIRESKNAIALATKAKKDEEFARILTRLFDSLKRIKILDKFKGLSEFVSSVELPFHGTDARVSVSTILKLAGLPLVIGLTIVTYWIYNAFYQIAWDLRHSAFSFLYKLPIFPHHEPPPDPVTESLFIGRIFFVVYAILIIYLIYRQRKKEFKRK